jgi:chorismate mutase
MPSSIVFLFFYGGHMRVAGVRGATTVEKDDPEAILEAVRGLLQALMENNPSLRPQDLASALFTMTEDLHSVFPAQGARQIGWLEVPLMCAREIPVAGALPRCIRVLLHWNTDISQDEIKHIYLREAVRLRPDLSSKG